MRRKKIASDDDVIGDLRGRHLVEPPRRVLAEAIALGGRLKPVRRRVVGWIADLLFDSGLAPATAGVRHGTLASDRRLLFRCRTGGADDSQLDLRLHAATDGTVQILGQLLPPWPDARVEAKSGRTRRQVAMRATGEFALAGIRGGRDTIALAILAKDGSSVVLDRVPMPARRGRAAPR